MEDRPIPALQRMTTRGKTRIAANTSPASFSWAGDKPILSSITIRIPLNTTRLRRSAAPAQDEDQLRAISDAGGRRKAGALQLHQEMSGTSKKLPPFVHMALKSGSG
jgi:hypothetical protein